MRGPVGLPLQEAARSRVRRRILNYPYTAELKKVLAIKTRDPRVGRIDVRNLSSAAELVKVLACA